VSSSGTPRITRGIGALTLPPDGSSSLAMWCSMSPSFPSPAHPPPLQFLIPPPFFPLTRWSSHLFRGLLHVLFRRAPCRLPVLTPRMVWARRPLAWPRPLRLAQLRGPRSSILPRGALPVPRCCPGTSFAVRCASTGVPAQATAAATHGPFSAGDTYTTALVPAGP
jgi:hypothetical protein